MCLCHDTALFPPTNMLNHICHTWKTGSGVALEPRQLYLNGPFTVMENPARCSENVGRKHKLGRLDTGGFPLIHSFIIWGLHKSSVTVKEFTSGRRGCRMFTPQIDVPTGLCGLTTHRRHLILPPTHPHPHAPPSENPD